MKSKFRLLCAIPLVWLGFAVSSAEAIPLAALDRAFDRLDSNRDGFLSRFEFTGSFPARTSWSEISYRFDLNDSNDDGFIDKIEYRASGGGRYGRRPTKAQIFQYADEDHDGYLDQGELALTYPTNYSFRQVMRFFTRLDRNDDLRVSQREYGIRGGTI